MPSVRCCYRQKVQIPQGRQGGPVSPAVAHGQRDLLAARPLQPGPLAARPERGVSAKCSAMDMVRSKWWSEILAYSIFIVFLPTHVFILHLHSATADEIAFASVGKIAQSKDNKPLPTGIAFMPFGGGATLCPGRRFARNEIKTLVVFLLQRFEIGFSHSAGHVGQVQEPGFDGARAGIGIFPPKKDVDVFISRRL